MITIASKRKIRWKRVWRALYSPEAIRYAFVSVRALHVVVFLAFVTAAFVGFDFGSVMPFAAICVVVSVLSQIFVVNVIGHRFIGHANFRPARFSQIFFLAWTVIVGLSSPLSSGLIHRRHHRNSDTDLDPHSPKRANLREKLGFFALVYLNSFNEKNFSTLEIMRESRRPYFIFFHRNGAHLSLLVSVFLFATLGLKGIFFLQTIPVFVCFIGQFNLVYQTHVPLEADTSKNHSIDSVRANILTLGEGAHNAHHRNPRQIFYPNERPMMFDLTGFIIKSMWMR
ncbi:hypothetical protein BH10BDE1_BH10BDE1_07960 [soil metagenome]